MTSLFIKKNIRKNLPLILLAIIILIGVFFRFYNYNLRWILQMDQVKDVLVGRISARSGEIPLLGSVSSAGFFFFGPFWYWFLTFISWLFPSVLLAPWIIFSISSVFYIILMFYIGKKFINNYYGLILALLTSVSFSQIIFSSYLTHHILVAFFTSLAILETLIILNSQNSKKHFLLLGIFTGLAINMHWQGLNAVTLLLPLLIIKPKLVIYLPLILSGIFITFIPLFLFDLNHNFLNFNSVIYYFIIGKNRFYMPNRWLTFAFDFLPDFYGRIIGLNKIGGFILISLLGIITVLKLLEKKLDNKYAVLIISFSVQIFLLRYFPGEKFDTYLIYLIPYILIFTAWIIYQIFILKKYIGIIFLSILLALILIKDFSVLKENNESEIVLKLKNELVRQFPDKTFYIYNYNGYGSASVLSLPLSLYLDSDNKFSKEGIRLGICSEICPSGFKVISELKFHKQNFLVIDLSDYDVKKLDSKLWYVFYPEVFKRPSLKNWKVVNINQLIY